MARLSATGVSRRALPRFCEGLWLRLAARVLPPSVVGFPTLPGSETAAPESAADTEEGRAPSELRATRRGVRRRPSGALG